MPETPPSRMKRLIVEGPLPLPPTSPTPGSRSGSPDRSSPSPESGADDASASTPAPADGTAPAGTTAGRKRPATFNPVAFAKTIATNKKRKTEHQTELVEYAKASVPPHPFLSPVTDLCV